MTTDEVKHVVKRHRSAAIIGGAAGLVVLVGWIGYVMAMTPAKPAIQTADASEVVSYIASPRGLARLSRIEQRQYLDQWQAHIARPENKDAFVSCLKRLDQKERKRFVDTVFKHLKRAYLDDAEHFQQLQSMEERNTFLREKVSEMSGKAILIREVGAVLKSDFPGPDKFQEWLLERTTPREQALGEPYTEALKRVATLMKKEARSGGAKGE
ncbi:MAG: hypothetical protein ACE5EC_07730 [Phycisphaerae bacterium]